MQQKLATNQLITSAREHLTKGGFTTAGVVDSPMEGLVSQQCMENQERVKKALGNQHNHPPSYYVCSARWQGWHRESFEPKESLGNV